MEYEEVFHFNYSKNTIWASLVLEDAKLLLLGGDFGKFHSHDLSTGLKLSTTRQYQQNLKSDEFLIF